MYQNVSACLFKARGYFLVGSDYFLAEFTHSPLKKKNKIMITEVIVIFREKSILE